MELCIVPTAGQQLLMGVEYLQFPLPMVGTGDSQLFAGPSPHAAILQKQSLSFSLCFAAWNMQIIPDMYKQKSSGNVWWTRSFSKYFRGLLLTQIMDFSIISICKLKGLREYLKHYKDESHFCANGSSLLEMVLLRAVFAFLFSLYCWEAMRTKLPNNMPGKSLQPDKVAGKKMNKKLSKIFESSPLPGDVVESPSVGRFKNHLDVLLCKLL